MAELYEYHATILKVVDGDTIDARMDLGLEVSVTTRLRLAGIDAPERNTEAGKMAALWLSDRLPVGSVVTIRTQKDKREKFGRYLAEVVVDGSAQTLNEAMLGIGLAKPYSGGKR